jgi:hypothetical protein
LNPPYYTRLRAIAFSPTGWGRVGHDTKPKTQHWIWGIQKHNTFDFGHFDARVLLIRRSSGWLGREREREGLFGAAMTSLHFAYQLLR